MRDLRSVKSIDRIFLCSGGRSGLILIGLVEKCLDRMRRTSETLVSVTRIGRGCKSGPLYLPNLKHSLIHSGVKDGISALIVETMESSSIEALVGWGVPLGHSASPDIIRLNFLSVGERTGVFPRGGAGGLGYRLSPRGGGIAC